MSGFMRVGSGVVVALGLAGAAVALLSLGQVVGWDATWRAFGVTPLQPPFFDMHVINDYAACAWKGVDPFARQACNVDNFNIPRTWLWLGGLGVNGSDSVWLAATIITAAAGMIVWLFRGRSWGCGLLGLSAVLSPTVMMGVERANLDLLILAVVGAAALVYRENNATRAAASLVLLEAGVALKLFPLFCVSLAARLSKQTFVFAGALAALSSAYVLLTLGDILLIRRNVPTTFILSYGYKSIFLGIDHIRSEAGLSASGLADTWLPAAAAAAVLIGAAILAAKNLHWRDIFVVNRSAAGNAFLFGAGIYCGTYLLATNFVYRLMFLLLCVPQLLDWCTQNGPARPVRLPELGLFGTVIAALWLNGDPNGHTTFLLLPQLLDWALFYWLSCAIFAMLLRSLRAGPTASASMRHDANSEQSKHHHRPCGGLGDGGNSGR